MYKLTSLTEIHRGGEHKLELTVEVDITQAADAIHGLDTDGVSDAQLDDVMASAKAASDRRDAELDAEKAAAAKLEPESQADHS